VNNARENKSKMAKKNKKVKCPQKDTKKQ